MLTDSLSQRGQEKEGKWNSSRFLRDPEGEVRSWTFADEECSIDFCSEENSAIKKKNLTFAFVY